MVMLYGGGTERGERRVDEERNPKGMKVEAEGPIGLCVDELSDSVEPRYVLLPRVEGQRCTSEVCWCGPGAEGLRRTHPNLLAPLELNDGVGKGLVETSSLNEKLEVLLDGRVKVVEGCVRWGSGCSPSAPGSTARLTRTARRLTGSVVKLSSLLSSLRRLVRRELAVLVVEDVRDGELRVLDDGVDHEGGRVRGLIVRKTSGELKVRPL